MVKLIWVLIATCIISALGVVQVQLSYDREQCYRSGTHCPAPYTAPTFGR
jgi:hypothetical protein